MAELRGTTTLSSMSRILDELSRGRSELALVPVHDAEGLTKRDETFSQELLPHCARLE